MFETHRMLGREREAELIREAERLHRGSGRKKLRPPRRSLLQAIRRGQVQTPMPAREVRVEEAP